MHLDLPELHRLLQGFFSEYWPHIAAVLGLLMGVTAAIHAAMSKNDVRAAISWVGVIIMSPLLGPILYFVAGINRIRKSQISEERDKQLKSFSNYQSPPISDLAHHMGEQFEPLHILGDRISHFQLRAGNRIEMLNGGDEAYPRMLQAIENAQKTIALQTYIFDNDRMGRQFVDALKRAKERGVVIKVLIDAVGSRYSRPPSIRLLRKHKIRSALFMTNPFGIRMPYANLRSHRKVLIVDGNKGFTGGMNIREGFCSEFTNNKPDQDTHFKVQGPIVAQILSAFAHDWEFTTKEELDYNLWFDVDLGNAPEPHVPARCIRSGPDRFLASTHNMLLGAIAVAKRHIRIQSPYFIPDLVLIGALNTAARRGVQVDIVIPKKNNLKLVDYAMTAQLDQVICSGCRVWHATGNFNHSKLLTIDGAWSYVGSSNMDARSLRLNFELDIEVYSHSLAKEIENKIDREIETAEPVTLENLEKIPFRKKLRNRIIWLASPYL